jgi:hypothetical protein
MDSHLLFCYVAVDRLLERDVTRRFVVGFYWAVFL